MRRATKALRQQCHYALEAARRLVRLKQNEEKNEEANHN